MIARVSRLSVTAIKGFGLIDADSIDLRTGGALHNRDFFLIDDEDELFSITSTPAFVPYWSRYDTDKLVVGRGDDVVMAVAVELGEAVRAHFFLDKFVDGRLIEGPVNGWLSELAGRPLRLVRADAASGGYDVHPVTLVSEASAADLGDETDGSPLDARRFRMLITCDAAPAFTEYSWAGREAGVGDAIIRFGGPVQRCAAVQRHPVDGSAGINALKLINQRRGVEMSEFGRGLNMGVYAEVVREGRVRVGDPIVLEDPADSVD